MYNENIELCIESRINDCVSAILEDIKEKLLEHNVSKEVIDSVFGPQSALNRPRLLHSNTTSEVTPNTFTNSVDDKKKLKLDWADTKDVVLVVNYTEKSHALFGDFNKIYSTFKSKFLVKNAKEAELAFGSGWIIFKNNEKLSALKTALKSNKITYLTYERKEFEEAIKSSEYPVTNSSTQRSFPSCTTATISTNNPEKVSIGKGTSDPGSKVSLEKEKIVKNRCGNFEGTETGLVFEQLPLGDNGKKQTYVIGIQNPDPIKGARLYGAILPLSEDGMNEANKRGYRVLTLDNIDKLKEIDKEKAANLRQLQYVKTESNEAVSSGSSDEEDED